MRRAPHLRLVRTPIPKATPTRLHWSLRVSASLILLSLFVLSAAGLLLVTVNVLR